MCQRVYGALPLSYGAMICIKVAPVGFEPTTSGSLGMYSNSAVDRCLLLFLSQRKERESNPQGLSCKLGRLPTGSRRLSVCPSILFFSSSTRNRTWNFSLEARDDVRFTIEPCSLRQLIEPTERKARESNPHNYYVALFSKQARRTVSGYLPYRGSFENRTRSSFLPRTRASGTLTNHYHQ